MSFTFPSHPGLILPLWAARPRRFDAVALAVGSVLPDLLDAALERPSGDIHRNFCHSLLGFVTLCVPFGFGLIYGADLVVAGFLNRRRRSSAASAHRGPPGRLGRLALVPSLRRWLAGPHPWLRRLVSRRPDWRRVLIGVSVGAFSHLFFDAITHRRFDWFRPWVRPDLRPPELAGTWLSVRFRGMEDPWGVGLFGLMWLCWSVLGVVLFFWCCWQARKYENWR